MTARPPIIHELKTIDPHFWDVKVGCKPFEARRADRDFRVGDTLRLKQWNPVAGGFTGDQVDKLVTCILAGPEFWICEGFCVMGLKP